MEPNNTKFIQINKSIQVNSKNSNFIKKLNNKIFKPWSVKTEIKATG